MVRIPRHTTLCTVCERNVGVRPNWERQQSGQGEEWRVARHLRPGSSAICTGGGIVVPDDIVFPAAVTA